MQVLIVDDNAMNRVVVREMLSACGASPTEAPGGEEALALIDVRAFDVVLMDLRMPGMDGLAAVEAIRRRPDEKAGLPVVIVTADSGRDIRAACAAAGADGVVFKPVSMEALFDAIAEAVAKRVRPAA